MMTMNEAVEALRLISLGNFHNASELAGTDVTTDGLCESIFSRIDWDERVDFYGFGVFEKHKMFRQWEHFSGCPTYPVPSTYKAFESGYFSYMNAFDLCLKRNQFYPKDEYGELRKKLAKYCADYIENHMKNHTGDKQCFL